MEKAFHRLGLAIDQDLLTRRLLLYESVGFALLIVLSWLNELIGLPTLLFGSTARAYWHEALLETVVILGAAIPTLWLTRRLARRLVYLEGFLHMCAWCRKVNHHDKWVGLDDYFRTELSGKTSHGICPECAKTMLPGK